MCAVTCGSNGTYEEGIDKRIGEYNKLVPIEGGDGVQPQTGDATGDRSELDILWGDPGDPVEVRHRLDDVVGEPEVDEHGGETVHEPSHSRDRPAIDHVIGPGMEGTVKGDYRQVGRPDSLGRVDEEPTS